MDTRSEIKRNTGWSILLGVLMIILGIVAIAEPFFATLTAELFLGWLFIAGGIIQAIYAFQQNRSSRSLVLKLLLSLLYIGVGILLLANPWAGIVSLTLLVGIFFFVDGVFRVILAFQLKSAARWSWMLLSGILMIILGILIWSQWPFNARWILGLLVGIGLLVNGIATVMFAAAYRDATRDL